MSISSAYILGLCVAVSERMVRRTVFRHLGTARLVIVLTAAVANLGVIPTVSHIPGSQPLGMTAVSETRWEPS